MSTNNQSKSIVINNIKNSGYRQVHVDGAHGGITPSGFINLNFYSQRAVIPKGTEFLVMDNGNIGDMIKNTEDSKSGLVREFEFGIYMDINTCINLREFLTLKIEEYEQLTNQK